ncbi:MAG: rRNA maturation RNase YbeY [Pseudobdellovibrio sp.]
MKLNIVNKTTALSKKDLQILVNKICKHFVAYPVRNAALLKQKKELTIVFLSSSEIKKINNQFRKKNKATDILSFAGMDEESLGELLLCTDVLKMQALSQKHSLKNEITYMLIHGLLHLLGYDHERSVKEEKIMFKLQDRCFADLGLV